MPIRIQLTENKTLTIRANADEWAKAYKEALENGTAIEVREGDRKLAINPAQIVFWEETGEDQSDPDQAAAAHQTQPA